jgi:hypothetical protein
LADPRLVANQISIYVGGLDALLARDLVQTGLNVSIAPSACA